MKAASGPILVYGAGGHGQVVASAAIRAGRDVYGVFDDDPGKWGQQLAMTTVRQYDLNHAPSVPLVIALGDNALRQRVAAGVAHGFGVVVHPSAEVAAATLAQGCQVLAGVIVNVGAEVGAHTILNSGCIVEHHVRIGSFVHVTPGAILCGACSVGDGCVVGPGAVVVKGKHVGAGSVLAAGTVVTTDVPPNSRVQGVPGQIQPLQEVSWDWG